jgi:hypothetical protein
MFGELKTLAGDSEFVLPGRGSHTRPFSGNAMNQAMGAITFPINPFTIHNLRRTASTLLHEQGFPSVCPLTDRNRSWIPSPSSLSALPILRHLMDSSGSRYGHKLFVVTQITVLHKFASLGDK